MLVLGIYKTTTQVDDAQIMGDESDFLNHALAKDGKKCVNNNIRMLFYQLPIKKISKND